jgi:hypothetical protein
MTNKKFNHMKGGWLILLCFGIILFSANNSHATVIPIDVNAILYEGPSAGTGYYTQYWLDTDKFGVLDAFCVDHADADSDFSYELVDVIPEELTTAAWIASRYFDGTVLGLDSITNTSITNTEAKVATQLAIWQNLDIATTSDIYYSFLVSEILGISDHSIRDSIWLAESPADGSPSYGGSLGIGSQDYLVSVPDADIMWLLGPAFIVLGFLGRKKAKEYL